MKDLMVYLKTTDTCQLNCDHCFTNGKNGKKGWFDTQKTIDFFNRLKVAVPTFNQANISFHGGEPLLAPSEKLVEVWHYVSPLWDNLWWSIQTNLTFDITSDKLFILEKVCEKSWGTSWDKNIRWPNDKKEQLWRDNVKSLADDGHEITVMICLSGNVVYEMEPIDIINDMASLGIKHINFERITPNGNALQHLDNGIIPTNKALDSFFFRMWRQCVEHKTYEYIDNMFFDSILTQLIYNTRAGCRCRECEQKIFTINADGSVGGCPNSATVNTFGTIDDEIETLLFSPGRMCNIQSEVIRNPTCYRCDVFDICNGDCHQLKWEGNMCAAPKSLMKHLKTANNTTLYKKFLDGFMGQE